MVILIGVEKYLDKIKHFFTIKILKQIEVNENFLNFLKCIFRKKNSDDIIHTSEKINV